MPGDLFATTSQIRAGDFKGDRYGQLWNRAELRRLVELYYAECTLDEIAVELQRPKSGIITKLHNMRIIFPDETYSNYFRNIEATHGRVVRRYFTDGPSSWFLPTGQRPQSLASEIQQLPKLKENVMFAKTIEKITLIGGENAANKTDGEIFDLIGKLEGQIKHLCSIEHKPKKLEACVYALQKDIDALIEYVDTRDVKAE